MVRLLAESRDFPSLQIALTSCGAELPIQWVVGTFFAGVKWPGHEDDRSPLCRVGVHGVHRDNLSRLCCSHG